MYSVQCTCVFNEVDEWKVDEAKMCAQMCAECTCNARRAYDACRSFHRKLIPATSDLQLSLCVMNKHDVLTATFVSVSILVHQRIVQCILYIFIIHIVFMRYILYIIHYTMGNIKYTLYNIIIYREILNIRCTMNIYIVQYI